MKVNRKNEKVIHVHFYAGHRNYYFGSVSALFRMFSEEDIGYSEEYVRHTLTEDGNHMLSGKVLIVRSRLIR